MENEFDKAIAASQPTPAPAPAETETVRAFREQWVEAQRLFDGLWNSAILPEKTCEWGVKLGRHIRRALGDGKEQGGKEEPCQQKQATSSSQ